MQVISISYACGDYQLEGIDLFMTNVPVVQQITVRLMLVLENLLELKSKQDSVTVAIVFATLGDDEKDYVEMPLGLNWHDLKVLKLAVRPLGC